MPDCAVFEYVVIRARVIALTWNVNDCPISWATDEFDFHGSSVSTFTRDTSRSARISALGNRNSPPTVRKAGILPSDAHFQTVFRVTLYSFVMSSVVKGLSCSVTPLPLSRLHGVYDCLSPAITLLYFAPFRPLWLGLNLGHSFLALLISLACAFAFSASTKATQNARS